MGMDILQLSFKDGEFAVDPNLAANSYFGGMPAAINTDGTATLATSGGGSPLYIGMFKNSHYEDAQNGKATVVAGASKVQFMNGSNQVDTTDPAGATIEGAPYDTTQTYVNGQYLYINKTTGLWTNQSSGNGTAKGIITLAPSSTSSIMEAFMFMVA